MKITLPFLVLILLALLSPSLSVAQVVHSDEYMKILEHVNTMSTEQKIGQLIMARAHSDLGEDHITAVKQAIQTHHVGGLCFFQGTPKKQIELTNVYQKLSDIPLLIAMDAEWGPSMRFKEQAMAYPRQLTLGAIHDNDLIYQTGRAIAENLNSLGVHVNFAPVVDINNNPNNPVIHTRSFGSDVLNVSTKSYAFMKGMQDHGLIACAKHFPGHGDTDKDSHYNLPVINHSRERLDSIELVPFKVLSQLGVKSMMSAHLHVPSIEADPKTPTSLSSQVVQGILRDKYHFDGLVFTDGLEMKGVSQHLKPGEIEVMALLAGNDILLLPQDIDAAVNHIKSAILTQRISADMLNDKVARILWAKSQLGIYQSCEQVSAIGIDAKLNRRRDQQLKSLLYQKAVTLVKDKNNLIPNRKVANHKIAYIALGAKEQTNLGAEIKKYGIEKQFQYAGEVTSIERRNLITQLKNYDLVIISLHDMSIRSNKNYGLNSSHLDLIYALNSSQDVVLVNFGSPYALSYFGTMNTVIQSYEEDPLMQSATAEAIIGLKAIEGKLSVDVPNLFDYGDGIHRDKLDILTVAQPSEVRIDTSVTARLDSIAVDITKTKSAPGGQIVAARNGKIFYNRSFGHHTYENKKKVHDSDIYDVASLTKILSTTLAIMKLYEDGKINIYAPIQNYLPELKNTNKGKLLIEDILAHHAGLPGWIPFYKKTLDPDAKEISYLDGYYSDIKKPDYDIGLTEDLFLRDDYRDTIFYRIDTVSLYTPGEYKYSDLGFYYLKKIVEKVSGTDLDEFLTTVFYRPMGLYRTGYKPLEWYSMDQIVPSEKDDYFRDQVIQGYVHDMGAAMLGGIGGHAGLFSSAHDLTALMVMLLNDGSYNGRQFLNPKTIKKFTTRYYKSTRRGLGFDMKELNGKKTSNISKKASDQAFGHLGFTGISVFADPKYDLVITVVTNRTFPTMNNKKFIKKNYRPKIQDIIYESILTAP